MRRAIPVPKVRSTVRGPVFPEPSTAPHDPWTARHQANTKHKATKCSNHQPHRSNQKSNSTATRPAISASVDADKKRKETARSTTDGCRVVRGGGDANWLRYVRVGLPLIYGFGVFLLLASELRYCIKGKVRVN